MPISPLRQRFFDLDAKNAIPKQRVSLSAEEALAELKTERDRVDTLNWLDKNALDLEPKDGSVKYRNQGDTHDCTIIGSGSFHEWQPGNREKPVLEYQSHRTVYGQVIADSNIDTAQPEKETVVIGQHDANDSTWFARRLTEEPGHLSYEHVSINYDDPSKSYKEIWLFNPQG